MAQKGNRDEIVLATKFTTCFPNPQKSPRQRINYAGNSTKSLQVSLEASLKKMQTDYIDLLYVHWWDFTTGIPELMQSLNHMVQRGKVMYLGVSDTPAWVVSKANECESLASFPICSYNLLRHRVQADSKSQMHATTVSAHSVCTKAAGPPPTATSSVKSSP
jgi:aryl-alcohol dehydrogenase-like predicted oxidoreductase